MGYSLASEQHERCVSWSKGEKENNSEDIEGDNMEKFSMLSYFKFRKNSRNPERKNITQGREFYFNF